MKQPGIELEKLLLQKQFEELSAEERYWVLEQMSRESYESMRWTLLESGRSFQEGSPKLDSRIQTQLHERLKQQKPNPAAAAIFNYKIPAWYAFAAASILFLLFSNFRSNHAEPETVYVTVTDTVYKEVPFRLVDSTAETQADTNMQISNKSHKRINQSPAGKKRITYAPEKKRDSTFVNQPNYEEGLVSAYDTATLNSMINDYLSFPKERRRKSNDFEAINAIQRVY